MQVCGDDTRLLRDVYSASVEDRKSESREAAHTRHAGLERSSGLRTADGT